MGLEGCCQAYTNAVFAVKRVQLSRQLLVTATGILYIKKERCIQFRFLKM